MIELIYEISFLSFLVDPAFTTATLVTWFLFQPIRRRNFEAHNLNCEQPNNLSCELSCQTGKTFVNATWSGFSKIYFHFT